MPPLRGPIFAPIRDNPAMFRTMKNVGDTIAWDNGADIDPDLLYYNLKRFLPSLERSAKMR
jgi:hypothetical protein